MLLAAVAVALAGEGVGLASLPFAELSVADPKVEVPDKIVVQGPFRLVGAVRGVRAYEAPLPVRPRALFFNSPPEGMTVKRGTATLRFGDEPQDAAEGGTWQFSADALIVRVKADATPPAAGEYSLTYPDARTREDALWRGRSGAADDAAFVRRSAQVDDVTRTGLYLPAPSRAAWDVAVPEGGVLAFQLGVVPPEVADGTVSDGADVAVTVDGTVIATQRAVPGRFTDVRVPLAAYGGRTVRLALATSDGNTARDHVLVGAPSIYVPSDRPRRTVLVFLDTMRRDHLGLYGYGRGATPSLDAWSKSAVVFEDARSVAPWTLPSTRSALTGMQPEAWGPAETLPERLGAAGWATAAYVGNVYLSSNFDMADGWGEHGCVNWPYARYEVDRALDFLDRNPDRDALVMVHFMDLHLPYKEPSAYRGLYEEAQPASLPEGFNRNMLLNAARHNQDAIKRYLMARYDQNLRYVDTELGRLFGKLGDDATVVVFADHGEEFFDHGDVEHGHTLYDELLRIPLLVKAPGLAPRRVNAPVSLLDLTPTVLDLAGRADTALAGQSLLPLARGEDDPELANRPLAFGRPLYGDAAWGSVVNGMKYISRSGEELVFDTRADAGEATNLRAARDPAPSRAGLGTALRRDTALAFRILPAGKGSGSFGVTFTVPGGIAEAWANEDPTKKSSAEIVRVDDETITATFKSYRGMHREVFVVPRQPPESIANRTLLRPAGGGNGFSFLSDRPYDGTPAVLGKVKAMGRTVSVTYALTPLPVEGAVIEIDEEQRSALEMLGYLEAEDGR